MSAQHITLGSKSFFIKILSREGSTSTVYEATDVATGEKYALKENENIHQAVNEAKLWENLKSQYVIEYKDIFFQNQDKAFILMEYGDTNLEKYLERRTIDLQTAKMISYDILKGLEYLHKHGVSHTDLCDKNVIVFKESETKIKCVKITDFGKAKKDATDFPTDVIRAGDIMDYLLDKAEIDENQKPSFLEKMMANNASSRPKVDDVLKETWFDSVKNF